MNLTAPHLLKARHYSTDLAHSESTLCFLRTRENEEVDCVFLREKKPWMLVECQSNDLSPAPSLVKFSTKLQPPICSNSSTR